MISPKLVSYNKKCAYCEIKLTISFQTNLFLSAARDPQCFGHMIIHTNPQRLSFQKIAVLGILPMSGWIILTF